MQGLGSWNQFLKISNYLKTHSTSFPGARGASFYTLDSLQGVSKVNSCSSTGFNPCRGRWQMLLLLLLSHFSSVVQSCLTLFNPMDCSMPGFPVHHQLPEITQIHVHPVGDAIWPSHTLTPTSPALSLSEGLFQWVSSSHQVAKYWSFSFSISPSNKYSGLISFRIDWFDFLAVQGTLKSLLQHHSSKASFLWHSAFFLVQLSHPYMTTGKSIALTIWTFVDKVMSLLFNKPSRLDIAFLQGATIILQFHDCSHHLQWFGAPRNKVSHFSMWETSLRSWSYGL